MRVTFEDGRIVEVEGDAPLTAEERADLEAQVGGRFIHAPELTSDIAVIGLACRFPGASDAESYWTNLLNGVCSVSEWDDERFPIDDYYDPNPMTPGKTISRWAGILGGIDRFDADLFGISDREARRMDPQQRLLLETTWRLFEHAGYRPDEMSRSPTGVFIGASHSEYLQLLWRHFQQHPEGIDAYVATGNNLGLLANRLSYQFHLTGPSVTVDTACSSSLVAVTQAVEALQLGHCDRAIAGGVNVLLTPENFVAASRAGMLSPTGRCRAFDGRADGYVRSEGVGLVLLRRLTDALIDGDQILAVIRGTAVNQDGRTNGLTAPSGPAQTRLIESAWKNAGVRPESVHYIETHGTGTPLGDPLELAALTNAFGSEAIPQSVLVGSVKTNLGHLESAAGIASLIKGILICARGEIPATIGIDSPTPHHHFEAGPLVLNDRRRSWDAPPNERIVGVSAFGMGGTNAHVVLTGPSSSANVSCSRQPLAPRPFRQRHFWIDDRMADAPSRVEYFERSWIPDRSSPEGPAPNRQWLIMDRDSTRRAKIVDQLRSRGESADVCDDWELPPDIESVDSPQRRTVVFIVDEPSATAHLAETLNRVSGIAGRLAKRPSSLWVVTESLQDETELPAAGSSLLTLLEAAQRERPDIDCRLIATTAREASSIQDVLASESVRANRESAGVLYQGSQAFVPARVARTIPRLTEPVWTRGDVVLLVGGWGDLGIRAAEHLARCGCRLVIMSRGVMTPDREQAKRQLEELGAEVRPVQADVRRRDDVERVLRDTIAWFGRLDAVIMSAGSDVSTLVTEATREHWSTMLDTCAVGARNLLDLVPRWTRLVFFSSASSLFAERGQGVYAAAHAYLEGLVRQHRGGRPVFTIGWGPWNHTRLATSDAYRSLARSVGVELIDPSEALDAMDDIIASSVSSVAVLRLTAERRRRFVASNKPSSSSPSPPVQEPLPAGDMLARLRAILSEILQTDLGRVDESIPLRELGLDSITSMELVARLRRDLGLAGVSPTILFEFSDLKSLADHLKASCSPEVVPTIAQPSEDRRIAVIGWAGRWPGASSNDAFWDLIVSGRRQTSGIPARRLELARSMRSGPVDSAIVGGFIDDVDAFDARFFQITGLEAASMDPRHRLFLEVAYHALESAGYGGRRLAGTRTGVLVAAGPTDYRFADAPVDEHWATSTGAATIASRLAYFLDLRGPTMPVDTACSSSLVAIHLAMQMLRSGEIDQAIVGAAHLNLSLENNDAFQRMGVLSPSGVCRPLAASADGFIPGEGVAAVLLKPLARAMADGDVISAVLAGSAINNDGRSNGLTAPNLRAQRDLLREAWTDAGISGADVDYIEAHGTATSLGDPVELDAIRQARPANAGELRIGSVKSLIGHAEAAAGMAGLFKVILALDRGVIPPSLDADRPTPHFDWASSAIRMNSGAEVWTRSSRPRRAGVSAFGLSGTNAHLIVEEPLPTAEPSGGDPPRIDFPMVLSAPSRESLQAHCERMIDWLTDQGTKHRLADVARTLALGRRHHRYRQAVVGRTHQEWIDALRAESTVEPIVVEDRTAEPVEGLDDAEAVRRAFLSGRSIESSSLWAHAHGQVPLPTTSFRRDRHWKVPVESAPATGANLLWTWDWAEGSFAPPAIVPYRNWRVVLDGPAPSWFEVWLERARKSGQTVRVMTPSEAQELVRDPSFTDADGILWLASPITDRTDAFDPLPQRAYLELIRSLASSSPIKPFPLVLVTVGEQSIAEDEPVPPRSPLTAWTLAIATESSRGHARIIDLDPNASDEVQATTLEKELRATGPTEIAYRGGRRWQRRIAPCTRTEAEPTSFQRQGVYWIVGGMGGIGRSIAEYLLETYDARIILSGRTAVDQLGRRRASLDELKSMGWVEYLPCDVSRLDDVSSVTQQILGSLGRIDGVIHAAGVIDLDRVSLHAKTVSSMEEVLAPKVAGSQNLARILEERQPDAWLVLLSSISCLSGPLSAGLSDYSSASRFQADWARWLRRSRKLRATCILLSEWAGVGMLEQSAVGNVVRDAGLVPMSKAEALSALDTTISADLDVVAWLKPSRDPLDADRLLGAIDVKPVPTANDSLASEFAAINAINHDALRAVAFMFTRAGFFQEEGDSATKSEVIEALGPTEFYRPWVLRMLDRFAAAGALEERNERLIRCSGGSWPLAIPRPAQPNTGTLPMGVQAMARLTRSFGDQLASIVRGEVDPVELLFPAGNLEEVAAIHSEHCVADAFATLVARKLQSIVQHAPAGRRCRVLEVGAGVGGTTVPVLRALDLANVDYTFTDISVGFFARAKQKLSFWQGMIDFRTLNLDWPPSDQGYRPASFDVVVATNVLHATKDLAGTLSHLREVLAPGGTLLLTELIDVPAWIEITFGLTEGWWSFVDADRRDIGPILQQSSWQALFEAEGWNLVDVEPVTSDGLSSSGQRLFTVHAPMPQASLDNTDIEQWLMEFLSQSTKIPLDEWSSQRNFMDVGIDSIVALQIRRDLERTLGVSLDGTLIYRYPNVEQLARHLATEFASALARCLPAEARSEAKPAIVPKTLPARVSVTDPPAKSTPRHHDIAIIAVSGRFPGADTPEAYWQNILRGSLTTGVMPTSRMMDQSGAFDRADLVGSFMRNVEDFDASFFSISASEARRMDPQQRLFLETTWELFERAGLSPETMAGQRCAVFVGTNTNEYARMLAEVGEDRDPHAQSGNTASAVATRVAYHFDLRGPAMTLDSACSSSLSAVHLAASGLCLGSFDWAIAGGVNVILRPEGTAMVRSFGMLSPKDQCRPFDADADGFVRAEGCAAVLLKRWEDAEAAGDQIIAVIKGIAVNNDGRDKAGYAAPSPMAQRDVIREALANADIEPESVELIEAHGTGTSLGDPIEWSGLVEAYGRDSARRASCAVGSVKSMIGHAESAAGMAGLIKAIKAVHSGVIPPSAGIDQPNPLLQPEESPFYLADRPRPWPANVRRAAVSSFGFGGTNVHAVLESWSPAMPALSASDDGPYWLPMSAQTPESLRELIRRYRSEWDSLADVRSLDLSFTASCGRAHHRYRAIILGRDHAQLRDRLELLATLPMGASRPASGIFQGDRPTDPAERQQAVEAIRTEARSQVPESCGLFDALLASGTDADRDQPIGRAELLSRPGLLDAVCRLYAAGASVAWARLFPLPPLVRRVRLPTYPFDRQRHWVRKPTASDANEEDSNPPVPVPAWTRPSPAVDRLLFESVWKRDDASSSQPEEVLGDWLVLAPRGSGADRLLERLRATGRKLLVVRPGSRLAREADGWSLRPDSPSDWNSWVREACGTRTLSGIVHLLCYGPRPGQQGVPESPFEFDQSFADGVGGLSTMVTQLRGLLGDHRIPLICVTSQVGRWPSDEFIRPDRAALSALVTAAADEPGPFQWRMIDLPGDDPAWDADRFVEEMGHAGGPVESVVDSVGRWTRSVEPIDLLAHGRRALTIKQGGVYLITGAGGGIGKALASWLRQQVKARLILVQRSPVKGNLLDGGDDVVWQSADVADLAQMTRVFQNARERFGRIDGVFHLAGQLCDGWLLDQTMADWSPAWEAKARGAWVLDRLTRDRGPDWMMFFSSVSSSWPGPGQAVYSAANRYLDALAIERSREGRVTISVQWGPWDNLGMAEGWSDSPRVRRRLTPLPIERALSAIPRILQIDAPVITVADVVRKQREQTSKDSTSASRPAVRAAADWEQYLTGRMADLLERSAGDIDRHESLVDLGLDSILVAQLTRELESMVGSRLSFAMMRDYPSIALMSQYLARSVRPVE